MKNIKTRVFKLASLVFLSLSLLFPVLASALPGAVGSWTTNATSIPAVRSYAVTTEYNDFVYVIGGWSGSAGSTTVYYAPLNSNGSVGTWVTNGTSLPTALRVSFGVAYNGFMYVMGGLNNSAVRQSAIYYAPINSNGSIGSWSTNANALPQALQQAMTVAHDGYMYVFGGTNISAQTTVYYAPINVDGSIGTWVTDTALPTARYDSTAVVQNNRVYLVGGLDGSTASIDSVEYASIDSDHSMGTWTSATSLPDDRASVGVAAANGHIYVTGGDSLTVEQLTVFSAKVKSDGTLGAWETSASSLPSATSTHGTVINNNFLYVLGGNDSSNNILDDVLYAPVTPSVISASVNNAVTSEAATVSTPFGTNITCSSASAESSLSVQDASYSYPVGLLSFCYNTDDASNQVTVTFITNLTPGQVTARHFNNTSGTWTTISGAVITATTLNSEPALQVVYTITDNGALDTNGTTGSVTDPVGLAVAPSTNTGFERKTHAPIIATLIVGTLLVAAGIYGKKRESI